MQVVSSEVGIVDKVHVPKVPPGDYAVSFRWDCEQTSQVWQSCGDVTIKEEGEPTKPFTPMQGCDWCCDAAPCANCTNCLNDKTGDCAYCYQKVEHPFADIPIPISFTCLGHEDADGGPGWSKFHIGDTFHPAKLLFLTKGVSPGCPKCWNTGGCTPRERA